MTIKKLIPAIILAGAVAVTAPSCKSSVKDADVKANVEKVVIPGVSVEVKDGVVTLNGKVTNESDKNAVNDAINALDAKTSGVKSVVNNIVVEAPATPVPVINTEDAALTTKVTDAAKDYPTVQVSVKDGIITVTGELEKAKVAKLKQTLDNLKPKKTDMSAVKVK